MCTCLRNLPWQMLRSEDVGVHYEAVGVIGNLVHSSAQIKRKVLEDGALQPVINLLSSPCADSQREAALLLGQVGVSCQGCSRLEGVASVAEQPFSISL